MGNNPITLFFDHSRSELVFQISRYPNFAHEEWYSPRPTPETPGGISFRKTPSCGIIDVLFDGVEMAEDLKARRYVMSLENRIDMSLHFLSDIHDEFREKCRMVAPGRPFPPDVIARVKRQYKEIRDRMAEIRAVQHLLKGKYRRVAKKNPLRDKKIDELGFAFKNHYSSFEFNLRAIERLKRQGEQEAKKAHLLFRDHNNNLKFNSVVKLLTPGESGCRSISIVFMKGDKASIGRICEKGIRVGEAGVFERYGEDEIRMSIAHGEESGSLRLQEAIGKFLQYEWIESAKCVIYRLEEQGDLRKDVQALLHQALESMGNRELRVIK
jgi:hypothetical protein